MKKPKLTVVNGKGNRARLVAAARPIIPRDTLMAKQERMPRVRGQTRLPATHIEGRTPTSAPGRGITRERQLPTQQIQARPPAQPAAARRPAQPRYPGGGTTRPAGYQPKARTSASTSTPAGPRPTQLPEQTVRESARSVRSRQAEVQREATLPRRIAQVQRATRGVSTPEQRVQPPRESQRHLRRVPQEGVQGLIRQGLGTTSSVPPIPNDARTAPGPRDQARIRMAEGRAAAHRAGRQSAQQSTEETPPPRPVGLMSGKMSGGPFIGPRGGKWADAAHTIPWTPEDKRAPKKPRAPSFRLTESQQSALEIYVFDPAHTEDPDTEPFPGRLERGKLIIDHGKLDEARSLLVDAANSADAGRDNAARRSLESLANKIAKQMKAEVADRMNPGSRPSLPRKPELPEELPEGYGEAVEGLKRKRMAEPLYQARDKLLELGMNVPHLATQARYMHGLAIAVERGNWKVQREFLAKLTPEVRRRHVPTELIAALSKPFWVTSKSLRKAGGPFLGPRGGLWADAKHTIPWKGQTSDPHCPKCQGHAAVILRQPRLFERGEDKTLEHCKTCNPKGAIKPSKHILVELHRPDTDDFKLTVQDAPKPADKPPEAAMPDPRQGSLFRSMRKGHPTYGPFIGPKGGKWADPQHKVPWSKKHVAAELARARANLESAKKHAHEVWKRGYEGPWGLGYHAGVDLKNAEDAVYLWEKRAEAVGQKKKKLRKAGGPYIGPKGGKWANPEHTVPWQEGKPPPKGAAAKRRERAHQAVMKLHASGMDYLVGTNQVGPRDMAHALEHAEAHAPHTVKDIAHLAVKRAARESSAGGVKDYLRVAHRAGLSHDDMHPTWQRYQGDRLHGSLASKLPKMPKQKLTKKLPYSGLPTVAPIHGASPRWETPPMPDFADIYFQPESDQRNRLEREQQHTRRRASAHANKGRFSFHGTAMRLTPELRYEPPAEQARDTVDPSRPGKRKPKLIIPKRLTARMSGSPYEGSGAGEAHPHYAYDEGPLDPKGGKRPWQTYPKGPAPGSPPLTAKQKAAVAEVRRLMRKR